MLTKFFNRKNYRLDFLLGDLANDLLNELCINKSNTDLILSSTFDAKSPILMLSLPHVQATEQISCRNFEDNIRKISNFMENNNTIHSFTDTYIYSINKQFLEKIVSSSLFTFGRKNVMVYLDQDIRLSLLQEYLFELEVRNYTPYFSISENPSGEDYNKLLRYLIAKGYAFHINYFDLNGENGPNAKLVTRQILNSDCKFIVGVNIRQLTPEVIENGIALSRKLVGLLNAKGRKG